ncbi:unnamed protein product [Rotaria sp. Silwood2]|nr:unnamed protein product [Rotaria sp. Silwood2]CAF2772058.1 unnamed protein product [Rotaria sp. Silwood2]CAF2958995.1 unnamed protein product [Rotaria sp. Silwood2]CAF3943011.1 unnamed protein product [Rotaria sp. Silwood2]CAF4051323.1 unnamed protein product [Rotaria sp. Silwood2]
MAKLPPNQERELRDAFDLFDKDHSGRISSSELEGVLKALNIKASRKEAETLLKQMDRNNSGDIDFEEFKNCMARSFFKKYSRHELLDAFKKFDRDGSGYITPDELQQVFSRMGKQLSKTELQSMLGSLDTSNDGQLSFDEFCKLFE